MKENKIVWRASFENGVVMEWEKAPSKKVLDMFQYEVRQENVHGKLEKLDENNQVIFTFEI